jgi:hypothetical protein
MNSKNKNMYLRCEHWRMPLLSFRWSSFLSSERFLQILNLLQAFCSLGMLRMFYETLLTYRIANSIPQ